jgi:hypothetical protein
MADQLDFGVNWVKDLSVRRASVFMDTFFIYFLFNMDYILSCSCSAGFTMLCSLLGSFDILITEDNFL